MSFMRSLKRSVAKFDGSFVSGHEKQIERAARERLEDDHVQALKMNVEFDIQRNIQKQVI